MRNIQGTYYICGCLLLSGTGSFFLYAQQKEKDLPDVDIVHPRFFQMNQEGFFVESDSIQQRFFTFFSLADWIQKTGFMNIRSYGPGMLSTVSSGGGNASQVQLLWNGIPLNHPMLGQADLFLFPVHSVQQVRSSYGSHSITYGSGSMSGFVNLQTLPDFNDSAQTMQLAFTRNSLRNHLVNFKRKEKKYFISGEMIGGKNEFYYPANGEERIKAKLPSLSVRLTGNVYHRIKRHYVALDFMGSLARRRLGNFIRHTFDHKRYQKDVIALPSLYHFFTGNRFFMENKIYYQPYDLLYVDSVAGIFSRSVTQRYGSIHNIRMRHKRFLFITRAEIQMNIMDHPSYRFRRRWDLLSVSHTTRCYLLPSWMFIEAGLRKDAYLQTRRFPFIWHAGINVSPEKFMTMWIKAGTSFRHPTGNELYWQPGGNPDLLPEKSEGGEAGMKIQWKFPWFSVESSGELFHRYTDHWILWTPGGGGFPVPRNIRKVWSRGALTRTSFIFPNRNCSVYFYSVTSYVLSTIEKDYSDQSSSLPGRQLIYTPRYTFNHALLLEYAKFRTGIRHHYEGYRFTTTDNTLWLPPFHLWDLSCSVTLGKKSKFLTFGVEIQNILNTHYVLIAGYPMPGRIWNFSLSVMLK